MKGMNCRKLIQKLVIFFLWKMSMNSLTIVFSYVFYRSSMDYGIFQMISNIDRNDVKSNKFLNLTLFGHQTLHHLFPTLDYNLLPMLSDLFIDTCIEFNIQFRELSSWNLIKGFFQQLKRSEKLSLKEMRI
jgi:fatty acid desaturase